jgi:5-methylcytosine-specific restriction endonuclease McrA
MQQGRVTAASVLDHIVPIRAAPERQHDPSNWQSLCAGKGTPDCHRKKTAEDMKLFPQHY